MTSREPQIDGDLVRFRNLFPRLAKRHDLSLVYLDAHDRDDYLAVYKAGFESVHVVKYRPKRSRLAAAVDLALLAPPYSIRRLDPELAVTIETTLQSVVAAEKIDLVHAWTRAAEQFTGSLPCPVLFDLCDALSLQASQGISWKSGVRQRLERLRLWRSERAIVNGYPTTFVASQDSAVFPRARSAKVIPNGVDAEYFRYVPHARPTRILVFSGSMSFPPNVEAVLWFRRHVWPSLVQRYPDVSWYIVGANPHEAVRGLGEDENIVVTGFVDDIRPFVQQSSVVVAPMFSGSGIKNKVLEAMACGRAVVTTPLGIQGIDAKAGEEFELATDGPGFVASIQRLLDEPDLANAVGLAGRRLVETRYSWDQVVDEYSALYSRL
jgi:glycosyltransferase involved in cell wall biosynthesis